MKKLVLSIVLIIIMGQAGWVSATEDPLYLMYQHYIFESIGYTDAYDGSGVTIAIVDSGINDTHEDLNESKISYAINFVGEEREDVVDKTGHGTFIAGIIGAQVDNQIGISGMTPNVEFVSLKCFDERLSTDIETIISCIETAIDLNVDVLNLSFTTPVYSEELQDAIQGARENQMIIVAPSGNDMSEKNYYPASFEGVVSVNSIHIEPFGLSVSPSYISNPNKEVTVSAPGDMLLSISHKDLSGYKQRSGSSYATAYVSGLAIMAKQHTPSINATTFETLLKESSTDYGTVGHDPIYGYGLINVQAMINSLDELKSH